MNGKIMNTGINVRISRSNHPCFNPKACLSSARMHLPIAKRCNIQCKFCNRRYDCVNESRPGVTSRLLDPQQALDLVERVRIKIPQLAVVGIAGPGDALANPDATFKTLELVHRNFPELHLCISTNGLKTIEFIDSIISSGIKYVTITINAFFPATGNKIYSWVSDHGRLLKGIDAARLLLDRQINGLEILAENNINLKVNTVLIPGINEDDILPLARYVKNKGAGIINVMPLIPVVGSEFEDFCAPSNQILFNTRKACSDILPSMMHCKQCRADAIGFLSNDRSIEFNQNEMKAYSVS